MIALALDTSGPVGSVAVVREEPDGSRRLLAGIQIERDMRHGVALFPSMEQALERAGVSARDIDLVAVGTGPGSFTGLRVGVTAARALAYAASARLLGVPSCDAFAAGTPDTGAPEGDPALAVVVDAKVGAVYLSVYRRGGTPPESAPRPWSRDLGPEILGPEEAAARIPKGALLVGDGAAAFPAAFAGFRVGEDPAGVPAAGVADLALDRHARGERDAIETVVPLYLRRTAAERAGGARAE